MALGAVATVESATPSCQNLQKEGAVLLRWRQTEMRNGSPPHRDGTTFEMPGTAVAGQGISTLPEPLVDWGIPLVLYNRSTTSRYPSEPSQGVRRPPKWEAEKRPGSGDTVL